MIGGRVHRWRAGDSCPVSNLTMQIHTASTTSVLGAEPGRRALVEPEVCAHLKFNQPSESLGQWCSSSSSDSRSSLILPSMIVGMF